MPVQQFAMSLNRRDHAGHHTLAAEQPLCFRLETRPGTGREFTQQLAIESCVTSQTPGGHTTCRWATGEQTSLATCSAVSNVRFCWYEGHVQCCWQEKATNISCLQSGQRTRAMPFCRSSHLR